MLFLVFELGSDRYALDARQIAEVLPLVGVNPVPLAPPAVAGLLNYHGAPVPVIDLSQVTLGRPAQRRLSTRIILVHYSETRGHPRLLGLIAERATLTVRLDETDFVPSGVANGTASFLGPVATDARGFLQRVDVQVLLPASLRNLLFRQPEAA